MWHLLCPHLLRVLGSLQRGVVPRADGLQVLYPLGRLVPFGLVQALRQWQGPLAWCGLGHSHLTLGLNLYNEHEQLQEAACYAPNIPVLPLQP